jgi:hypothetical protein
MRCPRLPKPASGLRDTLEAFAIGQRRSPSAAARRDRLLTVRNPARNAGG